jgi:HSP20 family protein
MHDPFRQIFGRQGINWPLTSDEDSNVITSGWVPTVDIKETDKQFTIVADIPGVAPKDIDVSMDNNILSIKGERSSESQKEENGFRRVERAHGSFHRRFSLPETADGDNISAVGKDGVLEIVIPKRPAAQPRRIEIAG